MVLGYEQMYLNNRVVINSSRRQSNSGIMYKNREKKWVDRKFCITNDKNCLVILSQLNY